MCDLYSGDVKYSIDASNQRRSALRLALRQGERRLQSELHELSQELYTFLLNSVTRQRLERPAKQEGGDAGELATSPLAGTDCIVPSSSAMAQNMAENFDAEGSGTAALPALARSTFSIAIKDLFDSLVKQVPDIDASETWGREPLLKRTAKLREANRELEHELNRLRTQHFALAQKFRQMRTFVSNVKTTLWVSMNAIVQELEANGASASGVLSVVHRFSSEWPDEAAVSQDDLLMTIPQSTIPQDDEVEDGTLTLVEELQHARRVEESKRHSAEHQLVELQASIPLRIQEAVRQATEAARDDSRLFQRLRKEYEHRIDELQDTVETLREEANKRLEDAKRLHDEEYAHVEVVQDDLANLRRATQLLNLQNEKLRNDFVHHKLKALNDVQQLSRQLRSVTEQLATRREEHVVKAEAEKPLLERIAKLTESNEQLGSDLRFVRNRHDAAVAERQEVIEDSIRLNRELQLARHDLESLRSRFSILETSIGRQDEVIAKLRQENSSLTLAAAESRHAIVTDATRAKRVIDTLVQKRRSSATAGSMSLNGSIPRTSLDGSTADGSQQQQQQSSAASLDDGGELTPFAADPATVTPPSGDGLVKQDDRRTDDKKPAAPVTKEDIRKRVGSAKTSRTRSTAAATAMNTTPAGTTVAPQPDEQTDERIAAEDDTTMAAKMDQAQQQEKNRESTQLGEQQKPQQTRPPSGPRRLAQSPQQPSSPAAATAGGSSAGGDDASTQAIRQLAAAKINPQRLVQALIQAFARPHAPPSGAVQDFGIHGVSKSLPLLDKTNMNKADEGTQTASGFFEVTEAIMHEKLLWANLTKEVVSLKKEYDELIAAAKSCCLCVDHGGSKNPLRDGEAGGAGPAAEMKTAGSTQEPSALGANGRKKSAALHRTVARPLSARPATTGRSACSVPLPHTISVQQLSLVPERFLEKSSK